MICKNKSYYDDNIPEIRFLPMSKAIFKDKEAVVRFLIEDLREHKGKYNYLRSKMKCPKNTLVLFQYDGKLIGCGRYLDNIKYDPEFVDDEGYVCKGYYLFDVDTMVIFTSPITSVEYKDVDDSFKGFSQGTRKTNIKSLKKLISLIKKKW